MPMFLFSLVSHLVLLIHAEKKVNDSILAIIHGVEDELKLEEKVVYKRRYNESK